MDKGYLYRHCYYWYNLIDIFNGYVLVPCDNLSNEIFI